MLAPFSNAVRENMSNPVEISTTNGQSWSISWVVEEEHPHRIVFTGGWRAFYEHYHLRIGNTMLFSYHQPKFFYVAIHDARYCEINYGRNLRNGSLPAIPAHGNYTVQFFAIIPVNDPDTLDRASWRMRCCPETLRTKRSVDGAVSLSRSSKHHVCHVLQRPYNGNQLLGPCGAGDGLHLYKLSDGPQVNAHSRWVQIDQSVLCQSNRAPPGNLFS
ncbi:hypothetical protein S83_051601, partial [Arachis hypogaea]